MATVFVTDGNERSALAIVRSLGRRGMRVLVGDDRSTSLASSSRHCAQHITYPSPARDRVAFERFVLWLLERKQIDVVLPVTDVTTYAMCAQQATIRSHAACALPPFEAFDLVSNKTALMKAAVCCDIRVPHTVFVESHANVANAAKDVRYPAVVKPARSRFPTERGWLNTSVHYASSERELLSLYQDIPYLSSRPSMIQERIVGQGVGVFVLFDRGRLVCQFGHRRLREKPPSGGVSVLRESVPVNPLLANHANRLLGARGWHGVAMLEYKEDRRTGELFLMEVNGRFWGSLQLAIDAGIDFPHLVCELAQNRPPTATPTYQVGVRSRWLIGDLDHLCLRLFKNDDELHLPADAPSRFRTCIDFTKFVQPNLHYEVARRDDWRPFLYEVGQSVKGLRSAAARFATGLMVRMSRLGTRRVPVNPLAQKHL